MRKHLKNRGFSLLEMVVVIAVMALVAGSLLPMTVTTALDDQRDSVRAHMNVLEDGVGKYYTDLKAFPATNRLVDLAYTVGGNWKGPYLPTGLVMGTGLTLKDYTNSPAPNVTHDVWGYYYRSQVVTVGVNNFYEIRSIGPDGRAATFDDIVKRIPARVAAGTIIKTTDQEMELLNSVIIAFYKNSYNGSNALPNNNWAQALVNLRTAGLINFAGANTTANAQASAYYTDDFYVSGATNNFVYAFDGYRVSPNANSPYTLLR